MPFVHQHNLKLVAGVEKEASPGAAVVPHGEGGLEMASADKRAAIECGIDCAKTQDLGFGAAGGDAVCIFATLA